MTNILLLTFFHVVFSMTSTQSSQIFVSPYSFSLNPDTHQLHTSWEVRESSISFICAFAEVSLMELSWTGESKELSSGNSWAVNCEEGEVGGKMEIEVDVTKFKVQPFRSYKVCINLEDSPTDSHLDEVCTHLFSFEKYVPYLPEMEEIGDNLVTQLEVKDVKDIVEIDNNLSALMEKEKIEKVADESVLETNRYIKEDKFETEDEIVNRGSIESVIKHQLKDIENFVRDDYKTDFLNVEKKVEEEINFALKHSSSNESCFLFHLLLLSVFLIVTMH